MKRRWSKNYEVEVVEKYEREVVEETEVEVVEITEADGASDLLLRRLPFRDLDYLVKLSELVLRCSARVLYLESSRFSAEV